MRRTLKSFLVLLTVIVMTGLWSVPPSAAREGEKKDGHKSEYRMKSGRHSGRGYGMHGFVSRAMHHLVGHAKELGLSDEQADKIKTIAMDFRKSHIRGEADWKLAEVEAQTLIHDEKSDLTAIEKAMHKVADAEVALRMEGVKAFRSAKGVLSPEQQEKWRALLRSSHGEMGKKGYDDDEGEEDEHEKKGKHEGKKD